MKFFKTMVHCGTPVYPKKGHSKIFRAQLVYTLIENSN